MWGIREERKHRVIVVTQQPKSKLSGNENIFNYQFTELGREHACQCCRRVVAGYTTNVWF